MGGHHSTQSVSASATVITNATMNQVQDCLMDMSHENIIRVFGDHNIINNETQSITFQVSSSCVNKLTQEQDFESKVQNSISQTLKDQDVAMMSWMTPGSDDQSTTINNTVKTNITTNVVQKCVGNLQGRNITNVVGSGNVMTNIVQEQASTFVSQCMQGTTSVTKTSTDMSDIINQHSDHTSKNPFSFISDAIAAVAGIAVVGIIFVILAVALLAKYIRHHRQERAAAVRASTQLQIQPQVQPSVTGPP